MTDRYAGGIWAGGTSCSTTITLRSAADGTELLNKVAGDVTASYRRQGGARVPIVLSDLPLLTSAWASGGFIEDTGGAYRLDLPDAAIAIGADYVVLSVFCAGSYVFHREFPLDGNKLTTTNIATAVLTATMPEGYAADAATMTLAQAQYMLWSRMANITITGTVMTCYAVDGSTAQMTFRLNDPGEPSALTRET